MLTKFLKKIKFLINSTNQHGVHSPFVFDYLVKCLYLKKVHPKSKTIDVLLKSIAYFDYNSLQILGNENLKELVRQAHKSCDFEKHPIDLIYIENLNQDLLLRIQSEEQIHNDSMVLINNIHNDKSTTDLWNQIIAVKKATVTIDFYYCGVFFFREEQVKEHFKIRI